MGLIKELREKVKNGTATQEEITQLKELTTEATEEVVEEVAPAATEEEAKHLKSIGEQIGEIALGHVKAGLAKDEKKSVVGEENDGAEKYKNLEPKERMKMFFTALFENDRTKLDHLSGGTNADGGFLVPQEYNDTFVEDKRDEVVMRRAGATVVQITSNTFNVPVLATRPRVSWTNELAAKSSTSASWSNLTLTPYTLAAYMTASNQVIEDAKIGGSLVETITRLLRQAIAEAEDDAYFTGSGTGQPTGLTTYTPARSYDAGGALSADDLIDAYHGLGQGYRRSAAWFMNSRTLAVVRQLKDSQNRPLFENALTQAEFGRVLGLPVYEQNDMDSDIIWFGDAAGYWIADRPGISVRVSDEASVGGQSAFERNFTIVRVEERTDGELADTRAFVRITNTNVA